MLACKTNAGHFTHFMVLVSGDAHVHVSTVAPKAQGESQMRMKTFGSSPGRTAPKVKYIGQRDRDDGVTTGQQHSDVLDSGA